MSNIFDGFQTLKDLEDTQIENYITKAKNDETKKKIAEASAEYFRPAWERRAQLESDADYVRDVLDAGAKQARDKCREVLDRVQKATGLVR